MKQLTKSESAARRQAPASNEFTLDVYNELPDKGNVFFSGWNMRAALSMCYAGARGKTEKEMGKVLHHKDQKTAHFEIFETAKLLASYKEAVVSAANSIWVADDHEIETLFSQVMKEFYETGLTRVDFKKEFEKNRKLINQWVEEKTREKIKDLFPDGSINSDTRMVLASAIYFKGKWHYEFPKKATRTDEFHTPQGTVKARMMELHTKKFRYAEDGEKQIVDLPYRDAELSMVLVLPANGRQIKLSSKDLEGDLPMREGTVRIPKFKFELGFTANEVLQSMGMKLAFSNAADFTGLSKDKLKIDRVIHKAFVEVDEEGTEAAAATGVTMVTLSAIAPRETPFIFNADRPFIFAIRDNATRNILFMGRVENPAAS